VTKLIVETPEGVELRQELAGAGSRAAAACIDGLVFLMLAIVLAIAAFALASATGRVFGGFVAGFYIGGLALVGLAYPFLWHVLRNGQTPGKLAVGVRVTSADGNPARAVQHLLRSLILLVDILPVPVPLGLVLAAVTPRHTSLGDLAAGTLVLRVHRTAEAAEPWPYDRWSTTLQPTLPLTERTLQLLAPRDVVLLRDLAVRRGIEPDTRAEIAQRAARVYATKLGVAPPADAEHAEEFLRELFLFARENAEAIVARAT
jgi:uncharacterized RDD family membrane protein YckC